MEHTDWLRQTDKPLFEQLLWSRPENRRAAGKLLIIGGHSDSMAMLARYHQAATTAGAGSIRLLAPHSLQKVLSRIMPEALFADATPSGGFSRTALAATLEHAEWADGVILAGDFGKNSETAIYLEQLCQEYKGLLGVSGSALQSFAPTDQQLTSRDNTVLISTLQPLQQLAAKLGVALTSSMELLAMVEALSRLARQSPAAYCLLFHGSAIVAVADKVSTTKVAEQPDSEARLASIGTVLAMQFAISQRFEALTTAAWLLKA